MLYSIYYFLFIMVVKHVRCRYGNWKLQTYFLSSMWRWSSVAVSKVVCKVNEWCLCNLKGCFLQLFLWWSPGSLFSSVKPTFCKTLGPPRKPTKMGQSRRRARPTDGSGQCCRHGGRRGTGPGGWTLGYSMLGYVWICWAMLDFILDTLR